MTYTGNFLNMTDSQLKVFEQIAVNNDGGHPRNTILALIRRGVIERYHETGRDHIGTFNIERYRVPVSIHMEWCDWCAAYAKE